MIKAATTSTPISSTISVLQNVSTNATQSSVSSNEYIGFGVGAAVFFVIVVVIFYVCKKRIRNESTKPTLGSPNKHKSATDSEALGDTQKCASKNTAMIKDNHVRRRRKKNRRRTKKKFKDIPDLNMQNISIDISIDEDDSYNIDEMYSMNNEKGGVENRELELLWCSSFGISNLESNYYDCHETYLHSKYQKTVHKKRARDFGKRKADKVIEIDEEDSYNIYNIFKAENSEGDDECLAVPVEEIVLLEPSPSPSNLASIYNIYHMEHKSDSEDEKISQDPHYSQEYSLDDSEISTQDYMHRDIEEFSSTSAYTFMPEYREEPSQAYTEYKETYYT